MFYHIYPQSFINDLHILIYVLSIYINSLSDEKDVAGFKAAQDIYDVINTIRVKDKLPEPPQLLVGAVRDLLNFNVNLYFVTSCVNAHVLWKHMVQLISSSKRNGTYSVRAYLIVVSAFHY